MKDGDKIIVKDLPHLNKHIIGRAGEIRKWHHGKAYTVEIDCNFYLLFEEEMDAIMNYPEHEKLKAKEKESLVLCGFLDFIVAQGWELVEYDEGDDNYWPIRKRPAEIIGLYLEIDSGKLEAEKLAMLEEIRKANG